MAANAPIIIEPESTTELRCLLVTHSKPVTPTRKCKHVIGTNRGDALASGRLGLARLLAVVDDQDEPGRRGGGPSEAI